MWCPSEASEDSVLTLGGSVRLNFFQAGRLLSTTIGHTKCDDLISLNKFLTLGKNLLKRAIMKIIDITAV